MRQSNNNVRIILIRSKEKTGYDYRKSNKKRSRSQRK